MTRRMLLRNKVAESFFLTDTETPVFDEAEPSCGTSEASAHWLSTPNTLSRCVGSVNILLYMYIQTVKTVEYFGSDSVRSTLFESAHFRHGNS